jgi:hypothetical protein
MLHSFGVASAQSNGEAGEHLIDVFVSVSNREEGKLDLRRG